MKYIHQQKQWPNFFWDKEKLAHLLAETRHRQGRLVGRMESIGIKLQEEATLSSMTKEIVKSNEIEGELLDNEQVRSSIARKLGIEVAGLVKSDRSADGVVEVMLDATQNFQQQLTEDRLFRWHAALFPNSLSGAQLIVAGTWRYGNEKPMQVVSGAMGREKVHFEAPTDNLIPKEMKLFFTWFNNSKVNIDPIIKAAIAHLWFVTIHPFEDGNGRLTRTITDIQLARADGMKQRFYSMSAQIQLKRKAYYQMLEKTQKGDLDITDWIQWFLNCLNDALQLAETTLSRVIKKAKYWEYFTTKQISERQRRVLNRVLDDFEGKLNTSKWAKVAKCSSDTALRDILNLIEQKVLEKEEGGGRSTSYKLVEI